MVIELAFSYIQRDEVEYNFALATRRDEKTLFLVKEELTLDSKKYILSRCLHNTSGGHTTYKVLTIELAQTNFWNYVTYTVLMLFNLFLSLTIRNDKTIPAIKIEGHWPKITVQHQLDKQFETIMTITQGTSKATNYS